MSKLVYLVTVVLIGCPTFGPDHRGVKSFCKEYGGFKSGNPIYFTCNDGSKWEKASHGEYNYLGIDH